MPFARGPVLCYLGSGKYRTVGPTEYVGETDVIHIPADTVTDLASVPRAFWALMPPTGAHENAAVLHDELCTRLASGDCTIPSRDVDALFRRVAREGGTGFVTRWNLWAGVRVGALLNKHRRPGVVRDLPLMALIGALDLAVLGALVRAVDAVVHALL